jgi:hypothetical protein
MIKVNESKLRGRSIERPFFHGLKLVKANFWAGRAWAREPEFLTFYYTTNFSPCQVVILHKPGSPKTSIFVQLANRQTLPILLYYNCSKGKGLRVKAPRKNFKNLLTRIPASAIIRVSKEERSSQERD